MFRALLAAALLAAAAPALAAAVPLPDDTRAVPVGPYADVLEDTHAMLRRDDIMAPQVSRGFSPLEREIPNFGYTYSAFWLRFQLPEDTAQLRVPMLVLEIRFPSIDSIELHVPYRGAGGAIEYAVQRGGDLLPWGAREVKHRNHVFRIPTTRLADAPAYLRLQTESVLTAPIYLWRPEALISADRNAQLAYGVFYGLVIALFLYNLMLLFALRDWTYLWYVLYVASFGIALAAFDGYAYQYLWPESVWWANHALGTALCATLLFGTQFARSFLDMPAITLFANRFLLAVMAFAVAGVFFAATGWLVQYGTIMRTLSAVACASAAVVMYVAVRAMLRGYRPARFFLLAWSALLVFIALGALRNFALVPTHFLTVHGLHIGLALDVVLLSFALADRINTTKREKTAAQAEALANHAALLEATRASERDLERRIWERTAELNRMNDRLREEAREREMLMVQLREQEQQMRHMAQHDPLTGLPNRISMQQRLALAMELAKRNRKKLAVMLIDLDDFKHVNDTRGHVTGDHALAAIAGRLRTSVRGSDTVARYGGDEFIVLAGDLDRAEDATFIAEKIADMVGLPLSIDGVTEHVSCSIGISFYPDDAEDPEALIERADRAMYAAKAAKGQRYAFFSSV
jgi:two-component system, sensor histidine kinase LadS